MNLAERLLIDKKTNAPLNYNEWFKNNKIYEILGVKESDTVAEKSQKGVFEPVTDNKQAPLPAELDDLSRLHFIALQRKACTIMEFGAGKSSLIFADALRINKSKYEQYVQHHLRKGNPFQLFSIESSEKWMNVCKENFSEELLTFVNFHCTDVEMTTFNGRACTMYKELPNICPDLIYLDGPDQYNVSGDVRGISTRSVDRLPMAADILMFEHFLLPGTLIIVDGRTANARFLQKNLQRDWEYCYLQKEDIHAFELTEAPLGVINEAQINFINS